MAVFTGAGVAITTPFTQNGEVDFPRFAEQIEYQIQGGTDAIIVCGTTGEASTLSHEEHIDVISFCVKQVAGRIPVIAGTGSNATETAVFLSQEAERVGADALLVVTPYYNKCTQKGLFEHFKIVADSVKIPVILYNIPGRTGGVTILPETVVRLCREVKNIVGVKDATDNFSNIARMMALADGCVDLYSGNDNQTVPMLALGAKGVISVLSNIAPRQRMRRLRLLQVLIYMIKSRMDILSTKPLQNVRRRQMQSLISQTRQQLTDFWIMRFPQEPLWLCVQRDCPRNSLHI